MSGGGWGEDEEVGGDGVMFEGGVEVWGEGIEGVGDMGDRGKEGDFCGWGKIYDRGGGMSWGRRVVMS